MTGICQHCNRQQPLDDGRHVAQHTRWNIVCLGSGKLSKEASEANAVRSKARTLAKLDRLRADAEVAHDAIATGRPWPAHQLLEMRKAALQEYRLTFHSRKAPRRLWFIVARGSKRARRSTWLTPTGDVYCTLCRELLLSNVGRQVNHEERTREHTTLCALRRLAKLAEYVGPPELRMPEDARPVMF